MLDLEALPGLTRAERVQALDAWLGRPARRRGRGHARRRGSAAAAPRRAPAPTGSRWSPSAASAGASCRRTATSTWSWSTTAGPEIAAVADALWYPIWDTGLRLDHSVRSVPEAVAVASTDVKAGLGLLDARLVAGDADLAARLRTATLASWRQSASRLLPAAARPAPRTGPASSASSPSCSSPTSRRPTAGCARGRCCAPWPPPSWATSRRAELEEAYAFLLDVRDELRRRTGRPTDVLVRQEQRPVAVALGLPDEDALLREVSLAGRRLAFVADETWRRVEAALVRRPRGPLPAGAPRAARRGRRPAGRRGRAGAATPARPPTRVCCCGPPPPRRVPTCCCRRTRSRCSRCTPRRCPSRGRRRCAGRSCGCWPAGGRAVPVLEQLDQEGLLVRLMPGVGPGALAAAAPPLAPVHRRPAPGRGRRGRRRADPRRRPARPAARRRAAARHRQGLAR